TPLTDVNPTGTGDWTGWTITTALTGNLPALYARNTTTGELWYYNPTTLTNLASNAALGSTDNQPTTPTKIAANGWTTTTKPVLQAADINRDGTIDLWALDGTGQAVAYLLNGTTLTAQTAQTLVPPTHQWPLAEGGAEGSRVASTADPAGGLTLSGSTGATWNNQGIFNPNVHLNANANGVLSTSGPAVNASASFSVSVWVKPEDFGGVVLSQDGANTSRFMLFGDGPGTKQWKFCLARVDSGWSYDCVSGNTVQLGVWTHLGATYNATTKEMALYVNGIDIAATSHNPVAGTDGSFRVGDYLNTGTHQVYYPGSVSDVRTWAGTALSPDQVALLSGTPGYVLFPGDDTNHSSGTTWTAGRATMSFRNGTLTISNPGYGTWTIGGGGTSSSVLTLQADGNLVIYPQAAHTGTPLWASATYNNGGAALFFQPDGNLVLYKTDGAPIWSSNTFSRGPNNSAATNESGGTGKLRYADFNGDGRADAITIADNGAISVKLNTGGDGHGGWTDLGQVTGGVTTDRTKVRFADFDGDRKADYIVFNGAAVNVWLNAGGDGHGGWIYYGQVATGAISNPDQVRFADFDGDGKTDYIITQASGAVGVFLNRGGDGHGGWADTGQVAVGLTSDRSRIRWADLDGDGKADYTVVNPDGSVTSYINHGGDTGNGWVIRSTVSTGHTTTQSKVDFTDLDGDGRSDYLVIDGTTHAWLSNGGDDFATPGWTDWGQVLGIV
ncbi:VCBS repeat protein, partial [Kitasatospora sp. SolWspMP-SS2h]|uniref:FG-GAP-like repeat-containing protein n=1 Tax=Kitasatospora sp. SolWspMP-SS2h TaxID=1305729 RepID=UPI000DBF5AC4